MLKKAVFTIGQYPKAYIGYTNGDNWNGWATPHFTLEEAKRVAEGFNECAEYLMEYDSIYDQFYILDTETKELETWKGIDYVTAEGIKHLYGIGAYCWIWDEAIEQDFLYLAQGIEDFIYEYEAKELYVDRKELVNNIKIQLKELTTFQQVYEVWHNDDLTEELKYKTLGGILTL